VRAAVCLCLCLWLCPVCALPLETWSVLCGDEAEPEAGRARGPSGGVYTNKRNNYCSV